MTIVYAFLYSLSHSSHDGPNRAHALRCSGDLIWTAGSTDRQVPRLQPPASTTNTLQEWIHVQRAVLSHRCSALARAGKAVLVLDPADTYGTSWASLSGADFVNQLINASLSHEHQQQQQQQEQPNAETTHAVEHDGSSIVVEQLQQLAGAQDCSLYTHPSLDQALENKGIIIDLAPRVSVEAASLPSCITHHAALHKAC